VRSPGIRDQIAPEYSVRSALGAAIVLACGSIHASSDGETIIQNGGSNPSALPCITCHGPDGKGMAAAGFPRLAGLAAGYIDKELQDFRGGRRQNPLMQPIATALTDDEIAAVATTYSQRPPVNVSLQPTADPLEGTGAWIALRGAWDRNIPECTLCHGPSGIGVDPSFPPLAGQSALYLENQLKAWRRSTAKSATRKSTAVRELPPTRNNDPNGLMGHIAASLTPAEMKAVAEYFAHEWHGAAWRRRRDQRADGIRLLAIHGRADRRGAGRTRIR
jgi:cytochrome c553